MFPSCFVLYLSPYNLWVPVLAGLKSKLEKTLPQSWGRPGHYCRGLNRLKNPDLGTAPPVAIALSSGVLTEEPP